MEHVCVCVCVYRKLVLLRLFSAAENYEERRSDCHFGSGFLRDALF